MKTEIVNTNDLKENISFLYQEQLKFENKINSGVNDFIKSVNPLNNLNREYMTSNGNMFITEELPQFAFKWMVDETISRLTSKNPQLGNLLKNTLVKELTTILFKKESVGDESFASPSEVEIPIKKETETSLMLHGSFTQTPEI
jgi:hypothetical protein